MGGIGVKGTASGREGAGEGDRGRGVEGGPGGRDGAGDGGLRKGGKEGGAEGGGKTGNVLCAGFLVRKALALLLLSIRSHIIVLIAALTVCSFLSCLEQGTTDNFSFSVSLLVEAIINISTA